MNTRPARILISSPGDVAEERDRARQVVEVLRRRYAGRLDLKPVLWEELPLEANASFQEGIDIVLSRESGIDIAVFILWSRLGSPLGALVRKDDGSEYRSGTERELDLMMQARRQSNGERPRILFYTRRDDASFDERLRGQSTDAKQELLDQKKLVENFIQEEFHDSESGANLRAYHSFDHPVTFSQRLRVHLQEILDAMAGFGFGEPVWDVGKRGPPFRGLEAFQYEHGAVFLGREDEIVEVRRAFCEQACEGRAFVLITGASGSGKSSLARAGVLPAIIENELDDTVRGWRQCAFTPGEIADDLMSGFVRRLADALPELRGEEEELSVLAEGLRSDPRLTFRLRIRDALNLAGKAASGGVRLLVLVDQLEELFTDARVTSEAREQFLRCVDVFARSGSIWILATVRSDFYRRINDSDVLIKLKQGRGQVDLRPPEPDALRRLIEEPARLAGLQFESRDGIPLSARLLREAADHRELLPLVEDLLLDLFEGRTSEGVLTYAEYERLGGVEGGLAKRAESVFARQTPEVQAAFPAMMKALVTVGGEAGSDAVARRHAPLETLSGDQNLRALVDAMVNGRLLTSSHSGADGSASISVAHEALLRVWERARSWVAGNREFLLVRGRIAARIAEGAELHESDPLFAMAKSHLSADPGGFSEPEKEYIEHAVGKAAEQRRREQRRRTAVIAGLSVLTLVAIAFAGWAMRERGSADRAARSASQAAETARANAEEANRQRQQAASTLALQQYGEACRDFEVQGSGTKGLAMLVDALRTDKKCAPAVRRLWFELAHRNWMIPRFALALNGNILASHIDWTNREVRAFTDEDAIITADMPKGKIESSVKVDSPAIAPFEPPEAGRLQGNDDKPGTGGNRLMAAFAPSGATMLVFQNDSAGQYRLCLFDTKTGKCLKRHDGNIKREDNDLPLRADSLDQRPFGYLPNELGAWFWMDDHTMFVWHFDKDVAQMPMASPCRAYSIFNDTGYAGLLTAGSVRVFDPETRRDVTANNFRTDLIDEGEGFFPLPVGRIGAASISEVGFGAISGETEEEYALPTGLTNKGDFSTSAPQAGAWAYTGAAFFGKKNLYIWSTERAACSGAVCQLLNSAPRVTPFPPYYISETPLGVVCLSPITSDPFRKTLVERADVSKDPVTWNLEPTVINGNIVSISPSGDAILSESAGSCLQIYDMKIRAEEPTEVVPVDDRSVAPRHEWQFVPSIPFELFSPPLPDEKGMPWVMGLSPDEIGQSKEAMSNNGASFFTRNDVVHAVPATSDIKRNHAGGFDIHFKAADSGKEGTFFTLRDGGDDVAAIVPGSQCVMLASSAAGGDSSKRKSEDRRSAAEAEQGYSHGDDMVSHCSVVTIDCLPLPAPRSVVTLNAVTSISLSPDCSRLAIANDKTELVLIDTTNGKPIYDIDFGHEKEYMAVRCMAVQFPSDARALLVAGIAENPDQSQIGLDVNIVDADTGEIFGSLPVCGDRGADPEYDVLDVRKGACFLRTKDATGGWFSFTPVEKIDPLFPASSQASSSALLLGDFFSLREPFTHGEAGLPEFSSVEDLRENLRGLIEFQHEAGSDSEEKRWISWLLSDPGDRPPTPASTRK